MVGPELGEGLVESDESRRGNAKPGIAIAPFPVVEIVEVVRGELQGEPGGQTTVVVHSERLEGSEVSRGAGRRRRG